MQSPKARDPDFSYDYPETPRPAKKRMQLTSDGEQILIPLCYVDSSPNKVLKVSIADMLPLPHLTKDGDSILF